MGACVGTRYQFAGSTANLRFRKSDIELGSKSWLQLNKSNDVAAQSDSRSVVRPSPSPLGHASGRTIYGLCSFPSNLQQSPLPPQGEYVIPASNPRRAGGSSM